MNNTIHPANEEVCRSVREATPEMAKWQLQDVVNLWERDKGVNAPDQNWWSAVDSMVVRPEGKHFTVTLPRVREMSNTPGWYQLVCMFPKAIYGECSRITVNCYTEKGSCERAGYHTEQTALFYKDVANKPTWCRWPPKSLAFIIQGQCKELVVRNMFHKVLIDRNTHKTSVTVDQCGNVVEFGGTWSWISPLEQWSCGW